MIGWIAYGLFVMLLGAAVASLALWAGDNK